VVATGIVTTGLNVSVPSFRELEFTYLLVARAVVRNANLTRQCPLLVLLSLKGDWALRRDLYSSIQFCHVVID